MASATIKIRLYARTDRVGSQTERIVEVDKEEWEGMDGQERDKYMLDEFWNRSLVEWGYTDVK